ncbi:MAG: hypothetical protein U9R15_20990, partial [Chloroflexota bacterium]|nr:hypothetical protein [Chloroflexota bacterium]
MTFSQNRVVAPDAAPYRVLAAVRDEHDLRPLLRLACSLARAHNGAVRLLTVTRSGAPPSWLKLPLSGNDCDDVPVNVVARSSKNVGAAILREVRQINP